MRRLFKSFWMILFGLMVLFFLAGCGGSGDGGTSPAGGATGTATVSGFVTGSGDMLIGFRGVSNGVSGGLPDVAVSYGEDQTSTDNNGFFSMTVDVPKSNRVAINFSKSGKVNACRTVDVAADGSYFLSVSLEEPTSVINVDLATDDTVTVTDAGAHKMAISNLQNALGTLDTVTVATYYGDPSSEDGRTAFPGDFMAAQPSGDSSEEADILLESVVFTDITITDDQGLEFETLDEPIQIEMRLPDEMQDDYQAGDYIPWWSFDEDQGIWIQENAFPEDHADYVEQADGFSHALIGTEMYDGQPALYALAYANHLSWWNVDVPVTQHAVVCVYVVDEQDNPLPRVRVEARGVTYQSSTYGVTDENGRACITVKKSEDAQTPERVTIHAHLGAIQKQYQVFSGEEGIVGGDDCIENCNQVFTPTAAGSAIDNSGTENWMELTNTLVLGYDGMIQGTATYEESGMPASGVKVYTSVGITDTTDESGFYQMKVPQGNIIVAVSGSQSVSRNVGAVTEVIDFVIPNQSPVIDSLTASPGLTVESGAAVDFEGQAHDPDGDALTYEWTASAGTPTSGAGTTFNWQAPADDTGTATIIFKVTDAKGKTASEERNVVYGGQIGGTSLRVTVKDTWKDDNPVEGAHVILHGTDNKSVQVHKTTGADGVADFGDIERERLTLTIAHETTTIHEIEEKNRSLETLVNIPAADFVFYLDNDDQYQPVQNPDKITLNLNWGQEGIPQNVTQISGINPYASEWDVNNFGQVTGSVYPRHLQTDGKLSIVMGGYDDDGLVKYGYLLDQEMDTVNPYTVNMNQDASLLSWSTDEAINDFSVECAYKGAYLSLGSTYMDGGGQTSGILSWAGNFPVGSFMINASSETGDSFKSTTLFPGTVPTELDIPVYDMTVSDLAFDTATKTVSWNLSGTADMVSAEVSGNEWGADYYYSWSWMHTGNPGANTWTLPDLPNDISDWVNIDNLFETSIWLADFDATDGFEDLIAVYISGIDPMTIAGRMFSYETFLYEDQFFSNSVSLTGTRDETAEKKPSPIFKSSGLLRR